ncbi:MAG: penicillin-binding transpeptidase domain-containing protein [Candidatus Levybacteria bacterium]|nr:penicillin-binding transpeptidase domain-containing protein [Candidatus Levybacteria bacterium]
MKPGVAFPDFIRTEKPSRRNNEFSFGEDRIKIRGFLLPLFFCLLMLLIILKLVTLTIFKGSYYRNLSNNNRMKTMVLHAPRGIIFDRNNNPLVFNVPGFRKTVNGKTQLIGREDAISLISKGDKDLEIDSLRQYPYKEELAHVLGYVGQISEEELKEFSTSKQESNYHIKDLVGKMGIEREYEDKLKGIDGKQLVEVDAMGKTIRTLGQTDPISGQDIKLTIDAKLQETAFEALKDIKKGVVIVSSPKGEILSMVSKPTFDANLFTMGEHYTVSSNSTYKNVSEVLLDSENQPLLNRAIGGVYPPGSTFKLITAAAGLEDKIIDENYEIEDTGVITVGAFSFANWFYTDYGKTDGNVNVVKAIKRSNDIFFYKLADMLGVEKLSFFARKFGLGERLGIDLDGERKGLVPTEEWKKKEIGDSWYLGDNYHYGIGQGYVLTTPLQVNMWTSVIVNKGVLYRPHLLLDPKIPAKQDLAPRDKNQKFISDKNIELIRQGMVESCETGGVAWPLFEFKVKSSKLKVDGRNFLEAPQATTSANFKDYRKVSIACKTGTAQHGGEETMPHAWITLFAPAYNPEIVITVLAESSGQGSNVAAPIAKKILEEWFSR